MKFKLVDYKGKHYIIQDKLYDLDYEIGEIEKEKAIDKIFSEIHISNCKYYGIPAYIGKDEDMNNIYKL